MSGCLRPKLLAGQACARTESGTGDHFAARGNPALYQGDFVEDLLNGEWFLLRREELRRKYLDALLHLGQLFFAQQDYAIAAECYRRAIEKDEVWRKRIAN